VCQPLRLGCAQHGVGEPDRPQDDQAGVERPDPPEELELGEGALRPELGQDTGVELAGQGRPGDPAQALDLLGRQPRPRLDPEQPVRLGERGQLLTGQGERPPELPAIALRVSAAWADRRRAEITDQAAAS
jgi:hypothetical protein